MTIRSGGTLFLFATMLFAAPPVALAQSGGMHMQSSGMHMTMSDSPAHFAPTKEAYTGNHRFLVKLLSVPKPIPYEKYFDLRFAVYDAKHPGKRLSHAQLSVFAGMRHGLKHGFAHGMQSSPKVADDNGVFTVSGMYFHMMGPWVLQATVQQGNEKGVADFRLPCCGK